MAKVVTSKNRRSRQVGNVNVHHDSAGDDAGFKRFRTGHELAKPVTTKDGEQIFETPTGKKFRVTKMSS